MGSNMYVHVEVRDSSQRLPNWNYVPGDFYDGRNSTIFALLAGVRNHEGIQPLAAPRGLPEDATNEVKRIYYAEADLQDPEDQVTTWFTLAELEEKVDWERFIGVWHESDFSVRTMAKLRKLYEHNSEVRIIVWFDDTLADLEPIEGRSYSFTPRG